MASGERDIEKRVVTLGADRSVHRIILKEFGRPEDEGYGPAYRRALEEITAGFNLSSQDLRELADEQDMALEDRLAHREGKKIDRKLSRRELAGITDSVVEYQRNRLNK